MERKHSRNAVRTGGHDVTGIEAVSNTQQQDDCWYGLNGMRLSQPVKKGIYVHRGKKIVIK